MILVPFATQALLTITLTTRVTRHRLIEHHGTAKFGGTLAHKTYRVVDPLDWLYLGFISLSMVHNIFRPT